LLDQKYEKVADDEAKAKLKRRYGSFSKRMHQFKSDNLLEIFLTSMTTSFDPHTTYMSASTEQNFTIQMGLNLEGIGASLQYDDGYTKVAKIIPGGAADKDGRLKPNDRVVAVGQGDDKDMVDVIDMNLDEVVKMIRGKPNTVVSLKVLPGGVGEPKVYKITRAKIELKDSEARSVIIEDGKKPNGEAYRVGVINLPSFYLDMEGARANRDDYKSTTRDVKKILDEFNDKGVDMCVVDLRKNGGGSLQEVVTLTGLFIDEGPVVQIKESDGKVDALKDLDRGVVWNGPLVVMIDKFSASASEIFAGAIQDYNRGLVIGDKTTHGKGSVQRLLDLRQRFFGVANGPALGALKITTSKFYRPNGESTQNRGVVSDIELPSITTYMDVGESDLEYALPFDTVDPETYHRTNLVNQKMIEELRAKSKARIDASADFKKTYEKIENYKMLKERKRVQLNEEKFFADRKKLNLEKEEEKELEEETSSNAPIFKRDAYNNEALAICMDYLAYFNKLAAR
jgi:carboxyl-terminal processing protease